jgi:hypothetical protein
LPAFRAANCSGVSFITLRKERKRTCRQTDLPWLCGFLPPSDPTTVHCNTSVTQAYCFSTKPRLFGGFQSQKDLADFLHKVLLDFLSYGTVSRSL